ncbi:MAG: 50S ribosomal protein L6 [Candidatus Anstonellales archaeon]
MRDIVVEVPKGVEVKSDGSAVYVKGPKGEASKLIKAKFTLSVKDGRVEVEAASAPLKNTIKAHVRNLIKGVTEGFQKKMVIRYAHFPITIEVKGKDVLIKNFLGEKKPRKTKVCGNAKIEVRGQEIVISGPSLEDVSETAANLRRATRIKEKDGRVFQDGIYPTEEGE